MTDYNALLAAEELKAAKQILLTRGWTQSLLLNQDTGCVCAMGAIALATGIEVDDLGWMPEDEFGPIELRAVSMGILSALAKSKQSLTEAQLKRWTPGDLVSGFNDTHSEAEVLALFDDAITEAEARAK